MAIISYSVLTIKPLILSKTLLTFFHDYGYRSTLLVSCLRASFYYGQLVDQWKVVALNSIWLELIKFLFNF